MAQRTISGIILAAGLGTRLRPLTDHTPKPVIEVAGQPLIFYALQNMEKAGVSRVAINTHYLAEQVVKIVQSRKWPFKVVFSHEPEILGTGGGIKKACQLLPKSDAILVQNSDALTELDTEAFLNSHFNSNPLSTLLLKTVDDPDAYGVIVTDSENRVRDVVGALGYQGLFEHRRMFCGIQLLNSSITDWMPQENEFCILRDVLIPALKSGAIVRAFENTRFYCDVGTPDRLASANRHFLK